MSTLEPQGVAVVIKADHLCYDRETEILTTEGWVRFDHLEKGMPVAQVDTQDARHELRRTNRICALSLPRPDDSLAEQEC